MTDKKETKSHLESASREKKKNIKFLQKKIEMWIFVDDIVFITPSLTHGHLIMGDIVCVML